MAHTRIIADEIACLDEEIQKIEPPRLSLEEFIAHDRRLQSFVEQGREIGIACRDEVVEIGFGLVAKGLATWPRSEFSLNPSTPSL